MTEDRGQMLPVRALTGGVVVTVLLLILVGWNLRYTYIDFTEVATKGLRLQNLSGVIVHIDEVLTMSARMAASTGDMKWERRYRTFEPELDAAIKEAMKIAPDVYGESGAEETDTANIKLIEMENKAFALVRQGRLKNAFAILFSREYEKQKIIYADGIKKITDSLHKRIKTDHRALQKRMVWIGLFSVVSLLVLIVSWSGVVLLMRRYIAERNRAEEELEGVNYKLESRVRERTAELSRTNETLLRSRKDMQKAYDDLKELDLMKGDFLSTINHELRTPLTIVIGNTRAIIQDMDEMPTEVMKDFLSDVGEQANHLMNLINDILDVANIENSKFSIKLEEVDVLTIITDSIKETKAAAKKKGVTIKNGINGYIPINLTADPSRLKQVMIHLLDNAVKFTPQGGDISVRVEKDDNTVCVSVKDNGVGIPKKKMEHLFDHFYQTDNSSTRQYGGLGLGLTIVKQIVELHKGRVEVESEEGKGSVFSFFLPVRGIYV